MGDAGSQTSGQAKKHTKAKALTDSKNDRVRYRARKQPQRAVLSAQQVVGKVKAAEHIRTGADNADGC